LNLANLVRRVIQPALAESEDEPLYCEGWHAFRRSLATNLHTLGVDSRITQAILGHGNMRTTLEFYAQIPDADSRTALAKIDQWIKDGT
jgi:site-specific recombinase XerD